MWSKDDRSDARFGRVSVWGYRQHLCRTEGDDEGSGLCQSTVRSDAAGDGSYGSFNFFDRWDSEVG